MTITRKLKSEFMGVVGQDLIDAPFTTIQNRAKVNRSFAPIFGNTRIMVNSISKVINESGPNGEEVWETDKKDSRIRFIGEWSTDFNVHGMRIGSDADKGSVEISFYGTYLNLISFFDGGSRDFRSTVDGGSESSNFAPTSASAILTGRNTKSNMIVNVVKDLTEGWHTVRIRHTSSNTLIFGFEFGNNSTDIKILEGNAFVNGYQFSSDVIISTPYKTGFENVLDASIGVRGGKAVVYIDSVDNTLKKKLALTGSTSKFMGDTDFSNSVVTKIMSPKEFGRNRGDDFSTLAGVSLRAFSLDDGSTTWVGHNVASDSTQDIRVSQSVGRLVIHFFGSGFSCEQKVLTYTGVSDVDTTFFLVDGVNIGVAGQEGTLDWRDFGVVSGLPLCWHTIEIKMDVDGSHDVYYRNFKTYEPKRPSIPEGSLKICEYNILADYITDSVFGNRQYGVSTGVVRKAATREAIYVGSSWTASLNPLDGLTGIVLHRNGAGASFSQVFYGTGMELRWAADVNRSTNILVDVDGSTNHSALNTGIYGQGSFNAATGILSQNGAGSEYMSGLYITGLPLGVHKITFTNNGANFMQNHAIDIVTPTYSNNTSIGSNSLKDLRNFESGKVVGELKDSIVSTCKYHYNNSNVQASRNVSQVLSTGAQVVDIFFEDIVIDEYIPSANVFNSSRHTAVAVDTKFKYRQYVQTDAGTFNNSEEAASSIFGILEKDVLNMGDN